MKTNKSNPSKLDHFEKFLLDKESEWEHEHQTGFEDTFSVPDNWDAIAKKLGHQSEPEEKETLQVTVVRTLEAEEYVEATKTNNEGAKVVSLRKFWAVASSLAAMIVFVVGYHFHVVGTFDPAEENIAHHETEHHQLSEKNFDNQNENTAFQQVSLPAELEEAEHYYTSIIAREKRNLTKKDTANWVSADAIQTLDELDASYKVMKEELIEEGNPRVIIGEMLENLRLRHQILEESIKLLEDAQRNETQNQSNTKNLNHQKHHEKTI